MRYRDNRFIKISVLLIVCIFIFYADAKASRKKSENEPAAGLFKNMDFEKNPDLYPQNWKTLTNLRIKEADITSVYGWDDETVYSGKHSIKIAKTDEDKISGWLQSARCGPGLWGKQFRLSAWVKIEERGYITAGRCGASLSLRLKIKGLDIPLTYEGTLVSETHEWVKQELTFVVPEGCSEISLVLLFKKMQGTVYWDDISIVQTKNSEISSSKISSIDKIKKQDLDQYGGYKKIKGKVTGYFHTERINERWWIITPEGNGFIVLGLQHMFRKNTDAERIQHIRTIPTDKNNMRERLDMLTKAVPHISETYHISPEDLLSRKKTTRIKKLIGSGNSEAPAEIEAVLDKIEATINKSVEEKEWAKNSTKRIKKWGFNFISHKPSLLGGFVYDSKVSNSLWGFPFIASQVRVPVIGIEADSILYNILSFPDVFDKNFKTILEMEFKKTAAETKHDPWLLGYFMGNELPWAGYPSKEISLFDTFFALSEDRAGKKALVEFLKKRYSSNIESFNEVWGIHLEDFKELLTMSELECRNNSCQRDKSEFLSLVADVYFKINYEVIKKHDPNHMILGVRFAGHSVPREVLKAIGRYTDIVTFQPYDPIPPLEWFEESYKLNKKPILVSEFSFKAKDSGLPNTAGTGYTFKTQSDRALWYERYVFNLLSCPYAVGYIWYKYTDDPPRAKGENGNYGLTTYQEEPYMEFIKKVSEVNHKAYLVKTNARLK